MSLAKELKNMELKIDEETWKSSAVNYLNKLANNAREAEVEAARWSGYSVGWNFGLISYEAYEKLIEEADQAEDTFWKEYERILNERKELFGDETKEEG